ncbi:DUF397 domain-containing protein [Streptomyces sp. NPDC048442]|uniref:DUF397 domain-containing protein n=1 Tax=Streptomyces sp. NPDC048442 TaxID=3154823 RepID=UPI003442F45F
MTGTWQKSSYCAQGDSCVHVATSDNVVQLIESGDPSEVILRSAPAAFAALTRTLKQPRHA